MEERKLKNRVGLFLIISQFILIIIVFILYFIGGYSFDETTDTISLMFPMLSVYTAGLLKFFINTRNETTQTSPVKMVTGQFVFLTWFLTGLFVFLLLTVIVLKPLQVFDDFRQFKGALTTIETLFAAFTGAIISALIDD